MRGALVVALLYAVCVLMPSMALALGDAAKGAHCLTETHAMVAAKAAYAPPHTHSHADGDDHHASGHHASGHHAGDAHHASAHHTSDHHGGGHHHAAADVDAGLAVEPASDNGDAQKGPQSNCCGLFCVAAMSQDALPVLPAPPPSAAAFAALDDAMRSRGPERIIKPPIA